MARRKSKPKMGKLGIILAIICLLLSLGSLKNLDVDFVSKSDFSSGDAVYVHFIDVGQGSSTLIQQGTNGIIIDAGEKEYGDKVVGYLKDCGIKKLKLAVASHPHSDHIGGLDEVIEAFDTEKVILPELTESNTPTTRVYEDLLTVIDEKNIDVSFVDEDEFYFNMSSSVHLSTIGPVEQSTNLNNMSLLCFVECFDTTFFIPGDAEKGELESVYEVCSPFSLGADIMAVSHHGSNTALYTPFLDAVDADVAVISCGKNNSYGHPHEETLNYIASSKMTCLRTDESGTIVFKVTNDGYSLVGGE